jgi:hypothetical protein
MVLLASRLIGFDPRRIRALLGIEDDDQGAKARKNKKEHVL